METLYSPQSRGERLIAVGRVFLAAVSIFAVWLDPTEPAKYFEIAYVLLTAYLVYTILVALIVLRSGFAGGRQRLLSQAFDLAFFSLFIYFTAGTSSPFIAYFVFALICGTLRWGWKGALWTGVASLAAFLGLAYYFGEVLRDPTIDVDAFIIRALYLAVVAVLIGYLGAFEERARREITALAAWPQGAPGRIDALAGDLLAHAHAVVGAPRAVMVWSEREEPWLYLAAWHDGRLDRSRHPPGAFAPVVAEDLDGEAFLCPSLGVPVPTVLRRAGAATVRWHGKPLHPDLSSRLSPRAVLAAPLRGEMLEGWLLLLDKPGMTSDDLELATIVGGFVAARLDLAYLLGRLRESAATEERIRLARDLHDGVLQSLTGIALRLAVAERQLTGDPDGARRRLAELGRLITLEQQDLRFFIDDLKPTLPGRAGDHRRLEERLSELSARVERDWNLKVEIAGGFKESLPGPLAREIHLIVREALVNSVRHGNASVARVTLREAGTGRVGVEVADNGSGFEFKGRYTLDDLRAANLGPRSLRERVAALGGSLILDSEPSGARLDIELPRTERLGAA